VRRGRRVGCVFCVGRRSMSGGDGERRAEGALFPASLDPTVITVSERQRGNPVLRCIRSVRWVFGDIVPDYICGLRTCVLFLSLKYHLMFPEYIGERMREVGRGFTVRLVLVRVDVANSDAPLEDVAVKGIAGGFGLVCSWSAEEGGRWLETLKACEHRGPDALQGPRPNTFVEQATACLTSIPGVNKTDVLTLLRRFKTLRGVALAEESELAMCPGIGPAKVARIHAAFGTPIGGLPTAGSSGRRTGQSAAPALLGGEVEGEGGADILAEEGEEGEEDDRLDVEGALSDDEEEKRIKKRLSKAPRSLIVRADASDPRASGPGPPTPGGARARGQGGPPGNPTSQRASRPNAGGGASGAERDAEREAQRARVAAAEVAALRELIDADAWE